MPGARVERRSYSAISLPAYNVPPGQPPLRSVAVIFADGEVHVLGWCVTEEVVAIDFLDRTDWESAQNQTKSAHIATESAHFLS